MSSIDFRALKDRIPLPVVLDYLGWRPCEAERAGLRGWCPIHSSDPHYSRTFSVSYDGEWFCHSCRLGGDGLRLFQLVTGLPLYEAAHVLAAGLKVEMPYRGGRKRRTRKRNGEEAPYGGCGGLPPAYAGLYETNKHRTSPLPDWWPV